MCMCTYVVESVTRGHAECTVCIQLLCPLQRGCPVLEIRI